MTSLSVSPRPSNASSDKAKELRQRIDARIDALAHAVDDVLASDTFKQFLDVQARFHRYSWHNSMLILCQCPNATRVAGFKTWQTMGRHVRKGERGIMIFAPRPWTREVERDNGASETESGIYFRPVYVFDVAQTDGAALPEFDVPDIASDAAALLGALERVTSKRGLTLKTDNDADYGYATADGVIALNDTRTTGQRAKTLAHELAHQAMHFDRGTLKALGIECETRELEAEAVAYVVCTHFGLECDIRCARYIAVWDGDGKALRASMERIRAFRAMRALRLAGMVTDAGVSGGKPLAQRPGGGELLAMLRQRRRPVPG